MTEKECVNNFLSLIFRAISAETLKKSFQKWTLLELKANHLFPNTQGRQKQR